ncbi:MAG: hypothetical protein HGB03_02780 [Candidatus Yonathbacteria bacterium]|nr:hypothetical protein [Candidatus Yonathbacteria bacterium]NTW47438.1 hypothetical protein [Candidatus Yonathbacteria bacterium]
MLKKKEQVLYIAHSATDWRSRMLSNDVGAFVMIDGEERRLFPSVTQFIEMIKYPEHSGWSHLDESRLSFDAEKETVTLGESDVSDSVGYMCGRPYNPVVFHANKGLDYREILKQCSPDIARKIGSKLRPGRVVVYLFGKTYRYGSAEHVALIEQAIRAKFAQNETAFKALLATEGLELRYVPRRGKDSTLFSAEMFCKLLTEIREACLAKRDAYRQTCTNGCAQV